MGSVLSLKEFIRLMYTNATETNATECQTTGGQPEARRKGA